MSDPRQCFLCGRKGTRSFDVMGVGYVCRRKQACDQRRRRFFAPIDRQRKRTREAA